MFKNLVVFKASGFDVGNEELETLLAQRVFVECRPSEEVSMGWVPPRGDEGDRLAEIMPGHVLLKLMVEKKFLPRSAVMQLRDEKIAKHEEETGRKAGRKFNKEFKELAEHELLPKVLPDRYSIAAWIDREAGLLMVDAGSVSKSDDLITLLVELVPGLTVANVNTAMSPAACMAMWLTEDGPPPDFSIDDEGELKSPDKEKSIVRYKRRQMENDDVRQHLERGMVPTRLAMSYKGRVSFVLTDAMEMRGIEFLDVVMKDAGAEDAGFDTDMAIATGELSSLIASVIECLGGESQLGEAGSEEKGGGLNSEGGEEKTGEEHAVEA